MAPISHATFQTNGRTQQQVPAAEAHPQPPVSQEEVVEAAPAPAPVEGVNGHDDDHVAEN